MIANRQRLIVGITGATGIIYGVRILENLKKLNIETHLITKDKRSFLLPI
jgi:flavin prenyltransferase